MENKKWYASKTIWGGLIMLIATGLQVTGVVDISVTEQGALTDNIIGLVTILGQFVGGVLAIWGRYKAKTAIV